jgi:transposase-like protein
VICPVCGKGMRELRRTYHKKRKWVCPECGRVRMQKTKGKEKERRERA